MKHILENWWFPALVLTCMAVSFWRSARRVVKRSAAESKIPRVYPREIRTNAPFRRGDFIAKADIAERETIKGLVIAMVVVVGGTPSLVAISRHAPSLRHMLSTYLTMLPFIGIGSILAFSVRGSLLARRSGLVCPACGINLTSAYTRGRVRYLVENVVLETGKCPACKEQLLDPAEVGPESRNFSPAGYAGVVGLLAVMIAGIITLNYFTHKQNDANAWARCRRLYARAYSASDSVVIDSTRLHSDGRGCEYFRRTHEPEPQPRSFAPSSDS
jgi:hypothetical protein